MQLDVRIVDDDLAVLPFLAHSVGCDSELT
jgi:hypothetical protein